MNKKSTSGLSDFVDVRQSLFATEHENGTRNVVLGHWNSLGGSSRELLLDLEVCRSTQELGTIKKASVYVASPGEWETKSDGKYEMKIKDRNNMNELLAFLKKTLGSAVPVVEQGYSELRSSDQKDQGILVVDCPASGEVTCKMGYDHKKLLS